MPPGMPPTAMVLPVPSSVRAFDAMKGIASSDRWPNRLRQCEIGRENGDGHPILPLRKDHRDVDAAALFVELDRAGEALCGGASGQVHRPYRLGDLDLVRRPTGFQSFRQNRRMAVAAERVLRQERLARSFLEAFDKFLLAFYWPVGDAEQQPFEELGADRLQQFG